ncbi:transposase family protein [Paenibacillus tyrfis]|uniref:H repeat-associated protein N-terminal domain-containing protein n=1 Tax=Paenibacillus tyrfis TaxID=1501230 RepID=A0A081P3Q2_9BACL|nr:hypothetical protein ET33_04540 [Paenibacillus tyrfis]
MGFVINWNKVLIVAVLAIIGDARMYANMETFAEVREEWLRTFLELPGGCLSHDTFGDILSAVDPTYLVAGTRSCGKMKAALAVGMGQKTSTSCVILPLIS